MDIKKVLIAGIKRKMFPEIKQEYFKDKETYNKYIEWITGRYYNFINDKTIRSIRLEIIKEILKEEGINFKESNVLIGYNTVNQIELI